jgi:two-component system response regulator YesN
MMLKAFLVDDEPSVLRAMAASVDWCGSGFTLSGTAQNGREALGRIEADPPELVITDVKMPEMDGIALSRAVRERWPDAEVIIISGYDDFEYARAAMGCGVHEYLLKPTDACAMEQALSRARLRIEERKAYRQSYEQMAGELVAAAPQLRARLLSEIAFGGTRWSGAVEERLRQYGCRMLSGPWYLCCLAFEIGEVVEPEYLYWIDRNVDEAARGCFGEPGPAEIFSTQSRRYILAQADSDDALERLNECCANLLADCRGRLQLRAYAAISRCYETLGDLKQAAEDCQLALEYRGDDCVPFEEVSLVPDNPLSLHSELDAIVLHLRMLDFDGAAERFRALYDLMGARRALFSHYYSTALPILMELYNLSADAGVAGGSALEAISRLGHCVSPESLSACVIDAMKRVIRETGEAVHRKDSRAVADVKAYVLENLGGDLSLQAVARRVHFSKNYLCSLFKRETGENLVAYITGKRVAAAKKLLKETAMKNYEIAEAVGYTDYFYFAQVFRKHTGTTMSEFQEAFGAKR